MAADVHDAGADADGPSPHYAFAHLALRHAALGDPPGFLSLLASPRADRWLEALLTDVEIRCGRPAGFAAGDATVHRVRVAARPCAVVELPPPTEATEAHFVALVLLTDLAALDPGADPASIDWRARFFTLESGFVFPGEPPRTVLGEWTATSHANYGDGPPPELDAFLAALEARLDADGEAPRSIPDGGSGS